MPIKKVKRQAPRKKAVIIQNGEGFFDFLKSANNFLKKSKIISTLAPIASMIPGVGEFAPIAGGVAGSLGYGHKKKAKPKKKMMRGRGLGQPGHGLSLAGNKNPIR
jgi:hypothetical protein